MGDVQIDCVDEKLSIVNNVISSNDVEDEDFVDPWNVVSKSDNGVDYDKLICKSPLLPPES